MNRRQLLGRTAAAIALVPLAPLVPRTTLGEVRRASAFIPVSREWLEDSVVWTVTHWRLDPVHAAIR